MPKYDMHPISNFNCLVYLSIHAVILQLHRWLMNRFPYQPDYIFNHLGEIDPGTILSRRDRVESDVQM